MKGSASILAAGLIGMMALVGMAMIASGVLATAKLEAQTAADAAALAAAGALVSGSDPLEEARTVAAANRARLRWCRCPVARDPEAVTVEVAVDVDERLPVFGVVTVEATAAAEAVPSGIISDRGQDEGDPNPGEGGDRVPGAYLPDG